MAAEDADALDFDLRPAIELNCLKWLNKVDGIKTFSKSLLKKSQTN